MTISITSLFSLGLILSIPAAVHANGCVTPTLSEIEQGTFGPTWQVEICGVPGEEIAAFLVSLSSEPSGNPNDAGTVASIVNVTGTFDAAGLLIVAVPGTMDFPTATPFNTFVLTDQFTGMVGDDLDVPTDGMIDDPSVFGTIFDALGIPNVLAEEQGNIFYGEDIGGTDLSLSGFNSIRTTNLFRECGCGDWFAIANFIILETIVDDQGDQVDSTEFQPNPFIPTFGSLNPAREGGCECQATAAPSVMPVAPSSAPTRKPTTKPIAKPFSQQRSNGVGKKGKATGGKERYYKGWSKGVAPRAPGKGGKGFDHKGWSKGVAPRAPGKGGKGFNHKGWSKGLAPSAPGKGAGAAPWLSKGGSPPAGEGKKQGKGRAWPSNKGRIQPSAVSKGKGRSSPSLGGKKGS